MEVKLQIVRCIKRTCHHGCNLVQFLQAFNQGERYQQGLYWLESQPSIRQQRGSCGFLLGQLILASAFTGGAKCYKRTHPKQGKISFPIVKNRVVGCGMPHYIVDRSKFWQFRKDLGLMWDPYLGSGLPLLYPNLEAQKREILKYIFFIAVWLYICGLTEEWGASYCTLHKFCYHEVGVQVLFSFI